MPVLPVDPKLAENLKASITGTRSWYDSLKGLASKKLACWAACLVLAESILRTTESEVLARTALALVAWVTVAYLVSCGLVEAARALAARSLLSPATETKPDDPA
jgi:hypothetical protein